MNIALLSDRIPPENAGGAERVAWALAQGLRNAQHEVHVIAATEGEAFSETREGIRTYHISARIPDRLRAWQGIYNPSALGALRKLLDEIKPDVVNAHNIHGALSWSALTAAHSAGYPVVFTAHDLMAAAYGKLTHFVRENLPFPLNPQLYQLPMGYNLRQMRLRYNPLRNALIQRILSRVDIRVCVSETQRQALAANGLVGFKVVNNGVDPADYDGCQDEAAQYRKAVLRDKPTALVAGRMNREKGAEWLLGAWSRVQISIPDAQLLLLARPEALAPLQVKFPDEMASAVIGGWLGGRELATAFCAADVVVVPSLFLESSSLVALEGMAARKPVIASQIGGLGEIVEHKVTGLGVQPLDIGGLADAICRLLGHNALAQTYGMAGRSRLEARYTLSQQVNAMLELYESAIAHRGAI